MNALSWLPEPVDWHQRIKALENHGPPDWPEAVRCANARLDFVKTERLARVAPSHFPAAPLRLALLGSATTTHLAPAIVVGALRRNLPLEIYEAEYGQYYQSLAEPAGGLREFNPSIVLLTLDARHVTAGIDLALTEDDAAAYFQKALGRIRQCWQLAQELGATVLQQAILPVLPRLLGENEHRHTGSPARFIDILNYSLREAAEQDGVHILAVDKHVETGGTSFWHDTALWCRSKQEISPVAAPYYGDLVARQIAALQGRSAKCLVLDLDNTLWGGVVGDDGLDGIVVGQGHPEGEGFLAVQDYAKRLSQRGIILAVCSKNDEARALEVFDKHSEMLLRRSDVACFVANWDDKASNLRRIAKTLNIGLDSLVFLDDNPFERNLVRTALPEVSVPEIPDEPALWPQILAEAGYFESLAITAEDRIRSAQYQANLARNALASETTDMAGYLRSLEMQLVWGYFDRHSLARVVQLINKTNQFNLTTKRTTQAEIEALMKAPDGFGIYMRLLDRFGDNGIIAIVIGRLDQVDVCDIDTWLMSCRVLGRGVEAATLNLIAEEARRRGATKLRGSYIPTKKNEMVAALYPSLGFVSEASRSDGGYNAFLSLDSFTPGSHFITIQQGTVRD